MRAGLKIFEYLGAPVYAHISVLLVFLYFYLKGGLLVCILSGIAFIGLMIVHEMGHAYFVRKYKHKLVEIRIYPLHGLCLYEYDARWLPETLIFAGGLIAQIVILTIWLAVLGFVNLVGLTNVEQLLKPLTNVFIDTNIFVFILNSLPIPGLDGFELWKRFALMIKDKLLNMRIFPKKKKNNKNPAPETVVELAIKRIQKNEK